MNCKDNCKFAKWDKTAKGRLSPSGDGECTWVMPQVTLPVSFYYTGHYYRAEVPSPSGGYINRRNLKDCPAWEAVAS